MKLISRPTLNPALIGVLMAAMPGLPSAKAQKANHGVAPEAVVGFSVRDVKSGRILSQSNGDHNFTPGSTVKLLTAQMALEALGPDTVFTTTLKHGGEIRRSSLDGDIVIGGSGDPALGSREFGLLYKPEALFAAWADSLRKQGIETVTGTLLADDRALSNEGPDPGMLWEDVGNYYAALATGLAFRDNAYSLRFRGNPRVGDPLVLIASEPLETGIEGYRNFLTAGPTGGKDSAYILGGWPSPVRTLRGTYPAGHWEFRIRGSLPNPGWTLTREWKAYLEAAGFRIKDEGAIGPYEVPPAAKLDAAKSTLATWKSPPLRDLVGRMLKASDNHVAVHLFAHAAKAMGKEASRQGGMQALQVLAEKAGLDTRQMLIYDGDGLTLLDRMSPHQMSQWLRRAAKNDTTFPVLLDALPGSPGSEEKLARYGANLKGKLWAKTGSMEGVAALAGYIKTDSGRWLSFAIFANHFVGPSGEVQNQFGPLLQTWKRF